MVLLERAHKVWASSESGPPVPAKVAEASVLTVGRMWHLILPAIPIFGLALFWRTWQGFFAFDKGLDATLPGFEPYWMSIFYFNALGLPVIAAVILTLVILTGIKAARTPMTPLVEAKRLWTLLMLVSAYGFAAYWAASYYAEEDAAWHQVTLRDTAFTPSHIGLFYGSFPLLIFTSMTAYFYARTRLPHLWGGKRVPMSFALMIGGSLLLLFQVAFNEFGHTFWQTEEVFSAPLHWPFVVFAWFVVGIAGVWLKLLLRFLQLVKDEEVAAERAAEDAAFLSMTESLRKDGSR